MTAERNWADLREACSAELRAFVEEAPLEREPIAEFVAAAARSLAPGARVADIGAGAAPYRELFSHLEYITVDRSLSPHGEAESFDVIASSDAVPLPDGDLDAIVCTQVLEHVPEPAATLAEFRRLLKPGGRLFLTAPLVWEEHEAPYDFFRYTRSGLEHLLRAAGFEELEIAGRGNSFTTIAQLLRSARWSLPSALPRGEPQPGDAERRLEELADEVLAMSPLDARGSLPLGFQVSARAPRDPAGRAAPAEIATVDADSTRTPILYIAPWVDLGGSDKGTIDWFRTIDRSRWAPSLITTQPSSNRWVDEIEPFAEEVWALPDLMPGAGFPAFILGFIETRGIEVVHVMNSRLAFDLMPDMTSLPAPPVLVVQHHAEEPDRSGYVRYVASRYGNLVDAFSVTSEQLAAAMSDYEVARSRISVITTGVDGIDEFNPEKVTPLTNLRSGRKRILWPGRLVEQKDPMLTMDVARAVRDRGVEFTLEIVGEGELEHEVRRRAEELRLDDVIEWHPPSHEMARWYKSCDLLLMTSTFEGVPYVIYESLAMAVPVVAPALPGNVELLSAGGGALISPRDDIEAYADAVERLLTDDELRRQIGRAARERMLEDCSLATMIEEHERLYTRLLESRRNITAVSSGDDPPPERGPGEPLRLERASAPERSVAVIVPCYQHGRFIAGAIDSVRSQSLPPERVIVVDDASRDPETLTALDHLQQDPRVTVIRLAERSGPSIARNRALAEVRERYVLPLDADDMLCDGALEAMVGQLERASDQVGFIYPNVLHFGNRNDYYEAPPYNLDALLDDNYCAAAALFDMRLFEAGVRYAEDIVTGHEDWELVLQLAARGVIGEPAEIPTLRYRKRGFSRVSTVDHGSRSFHELIEARHASLYEERDRIKGEWAPAVSLVLIDGFDGASSRWPENLGDLLQTQTCVDFETIAAGVPVELPANSTVLDADGDVAKAVKGAVTKARGHIVVVGGAGIAGALRRATFMEQAVRLMLSSVELNRCVLARAPGHKGPHLSPLAELRRAGAAPAAVIWRRDDQLAAGAVELGISASAIEDFVMDWQVDRPLDWRLV